MKKFLFLIALAVAPSFALATTYDCKAQDGTIAQFKFQSGSPVSGTLTYMGISFDEQQMGMFMEDYNEVAGKSLYVQVGVQDYGTNGIIFSAKYLPGSPTDMAGTLSIFGNWPMKSVPLTCKSQN